MEFRDLDPSTWQDGLEEIEGFYGRSPEPNLKPSLKRVPTPSPMPSLKQKSAIQDSASEIEVGADLPDAAPVEEAADLPEQEASLQHGASETEELAELPDAPPREEVADLPMEDEFAGLLDDIEQFSSDPLPNNDAVAAADLFASQPQDSMTHSDTPHSFETSSIPQLPSIAYSTGQGDSGQIFGAAQASYKPVLPSSSAKSYMQEEMRLEDSMPRRMKGRAPSFDPLRAKTPLDDVEGDHPVFGPISPLDRKIESPAAYQPAALLSQYTRTALAADETLDAKVLIDKGVDQERIFDNQTAAAPSSLPTPDDEDVQKLIKPDGEGKRARESSPPREIALRSTEKVTPVKNPPLKKLKLSLSKKARLETESSLSDLSVEFNSSPPNTTKMKKTPALPSKVTPKKPASTKKPAVPEKVPPKKPSSARKASVKKNALTDSPPRRLSNFPPEKDMDDVKQDEDDPQPKPPSKKAAKKRSKSTNTTNLSPATTNFPPEKDMDDVEQDEDEPKPKPAPKKAPKKCSKSTNTTNLLPATTTAPKRPPKNSVTPGELKRLVGTAVIEDVKKRNSPQGKTRKQKSDAANAAPNAGAAAKRRQSGK